MKFLLALLVVGCGSALPTPDCVSFYGTRLYGKVGTCADFQVAEDAALDAYANDLLVDWPRKFSEPALAGIIVRFRSDSDSGTFDDPWGRGREGGYTVPEFGDIVLAVPVNGQWKDTAFSHELGHWFEWKYNLGTWMCDADDIYVPYHCGWVRFGIWKAINVADTR